jgi:hypothetical protein
MSGGLLDEDWHREDKLQVKSSRARVKGLKGMNNLMIPQFV